VRRLPAELILRQAQDDGVFFAKSEGRPGFPKRPSLYWA
jgi:hypothetical protein